MGFLQVLRFLPTGKPPKGSEMNNIYVYALLQKAISLVIYKKSCNSTFSFVFLELKNISSKNITINLTIQFIIIVDIYQSRQRYLVLARIPKMGGKST